LHTKDSEGKSSERILWSLGTIGWGNRWTLLAWCEKRVAYRNFRFGRIQDITVLAER
jgi:predicted DNA-binding transcriptional regulator YafY